MIKLKDIINENWNEDDIIYFEKSLGGFFRKFDGLNYWPESGDTFKLKSTANSFEFELIPIGKIRPETKKKYDADGIGLTINQLDRFLKKRIIVKK